MNMWIVVLIMIPVVAIMIFGGNPVRDFQEKQREAAAKYGTDELTIATSRFVENHEKATGQASSLEGGVTQKEMISAIKTVSPKVRLADDFDIKPLSPSDKISSGLFRKNPSPPPPQPDDGFDKALNGTGAVVAQPAQPLQPVQQPVNENNYYPPIVPDKNTIIATSAPPAVLTGREARLRSGQVIIFERTSVYTIDASGGRVSMPDGEYTLQDGSTILVSGGKNITR